MSIGGASPLSGEWFSFEVQVSKYTKDVLYPGTYHLPDGRRVTYTPSDVRHLSARLRDMAAAGLQVPLCWDHQHEAKPVQMGSDKADRHKWNLGFATGAQLTPEGYLEASLDVPVDEDAKRLPAVRYVSPEIVTDYVDGSGRKWPGLSITHVAVTSRPVQSRQNPFKPVQLGYAPVWLSLGDMDMADDKKKPGEGTEGDATSSGPDIKKILSLLASKGVPLPEDTTNDNFMDRLHVALVATGASEDDDAGNTVIDPEEDDAAVAAPPPVTMSMDQVVARNKSLESRLVANERTGLVTRVKGLFAAGKITKQIRDKMIAELNTVQLSLDRNGQLKGGKLLAKIEAYEELAGVVRPTQLSMDGIHEAPPPADMTGRPKSDQEVKAAVDEWDAALGRK